MKYGSLASLLIVLLALTACNPTSRFAQQRYDDDLYYVSSGEAARTVEAAPARRPSDRASAYEDYLNGKSSSEDTYATEYDQPERYEERNYSRNLDRYNDPLWYDPFCGGGLGGYWGVRSYMLYNPYFPPFWSMRPGWNLSFGYGYGGFSWGFGYGNPWYGGFYDPFYSPWYNPWYNPWYSPWYNPYYGGGWAGAGDWSGNNVPRQPVRSNRVGTSAPPRPRSVFTSPRATSNLPANARPVQPSRPTSATPATRPSGTRIDRNQLNRPGEATPGRQPSTPDRGTTRPSAPSRRDPGTQPSNRDGSFSRPSRPSTPTPAPSRPNRDSGPSYSPPSRSGDSGSRGSSPSTGGGGGSRPSGTGGSRPR